MKKLITIIFASVSLLSSTSKASQLNLRMFDNSTFQIMLDGNYIGQPTSILSIDLAAGEHFLKVAKLVTNPWGMSHLEEVYAGCIIIPKKSKVFSNISCHGKYEVVRIEPICEPQWGGWGNGNGGWGNGNGGWSNGGGHNNGNGWGQGNNGWNNGGYNGNCSPCMTPQQFAQLKSAVCSQSFDNGKLGIVKQALVMNYFSSAQVSELMGLMTFDSYKLTLAQSCYPKTIDKQNFYIVNSNFVFSSSVKELNEYISHM